MDIFWETIFKPNTDIIEPNNIHLMGVPGEEKTEKVA